MGASFKFVAVGRNPSGVSLRIPHKTGRLAPFRYGLLPDFEPCQNGRALASATHTEIKTYETLP